MIADLLPMLARNWKAVLGGVIALGLVLALFLARSDARHYRKALDQEKAAHALDIAKWREAGIRAVAENIKDTRYKEQDAATITERSQNDLQTQLADARTAAANYASRMRRCTTGSNPGSTGKTAVGETAGTPSEPSGAGGYALVPESDLTICAANTVKAKSWQTFYGDLRTRYNTPTP